MEQILKYIAYCALFSLILAQQVRAIFDLAGKSLQLLNFKEFWALLGGIRLHTWSKFSWLLHDKENTHCTAGEVLAKQLKKTS